MPSPFDVLDYVIQPLEHLLSVSGFRLFLPINVDPIAKHMTCEYVGFLNPRRLGCVDCQKVISDARHLASASSGKRSCRYAKSPSSFHRDNDVGTVAGG